MNMISMGYGQMQDYKSGPYIQQESITGQLLKWDYSDFRVKLAPEPQYAYTSKQYSFLCVYTYVHT